VRPSYTPGISQLLASGNWREFLSRAFTQSGLKIAERLGWLGILLISAFGFYMKRNELAAWAFACVILYLMFLCGPAAGPRYALQAWPFLFILFAIGCTRLSRFARR
jgi:hypothetical protein